MTTELEEMLARELHEVAVGIEVPPVPSVGGADGDPSVRRLRRWQPLVAAAVVALLVGALAVVLGQDDGGSPQPAPAPDTVVPTTVPTMPFVLERRLYVDGRRMPGEWWGLEARGNAWLATQFDGTWWWGSAGRDPMRIDAQIDQGPAISPNGRYIAFVDGTGGRAKLTGFDTRPAGEGFGAAPIPDLPLREAGVALRVVAVTDEGDVIVQGPRTQLMWRALFEDQRTVLDLTETAPDQIALEATSAGLVFVDGSDDATSAAPYLATIDGDGRLTAGTALPMHDDLAVNPAGTWLLRPPAGSVGGEVTSVSALSAQEIGSDDEVVLKAPRGEGFVVASWSWESDDSVVAVLVGEGEDASERLVRCRVPVGVCAAFDGPSAE